MQELSILSVNITFQVPRSRLLPLPNQPTRLPASPVVQQTTPPPLPLSPSTTPPDPCPATRPPLQPLSRVPHPDATPITNLQSRHRAIHLQSLQHSSRHPASPVGTSTARTPRLQAHRPLQTPLRPPLMSLLLRPHLPIRRAHFPGRGPSPNPGTDRASRHPPNPTH